MERAKIGRGPRNICTCKKKKTAIGHTVSTVKVDYTKDRADGTSAVLYPTDELR